LNLGFGAIEEGPDGFTWYQRFETFPGGMHLQLTAPIKAIAPAEGFPGVAENTELTWDAPGTAIVQLTPKPVVPGVPSYQIFASEGTARIPNADVLGIALPEHVTCQWVGVTSNVWGTLADAAALGWAPARLPVMDIITTGTAPRTFVTR
jgi:hypothetical protein